MQYHEDPSGYNHGGRRANPGPPYQEGPYRGAYPVENGPRMEDRVQHPRVDTRKYAPQREREPSSQRQGGEDSPVPSRHLWVGNVKADVTEGMLFERFGKFGELESATVYASRNYAFVNYRNLHDAIQAKDHLQNTSFGSGLPIRIEFAKGQAKQSRHLWVGGISQAVSSQQLEAEFARFGRIEDFKFMRDRSSALVDYFESEDAAHAVGVLNGKRLGDETLRVDYGRSAGGRSAAKDTRNLYEDRERLGSRDHGSDPYRRRPLEDGTTRNRRLPEGHREGQEMFIGAGDKDGEPSEVLWVGFPLYIKVDEDRLRDAFQFYGPVKRVKCFPGRTYAFVQMERLDDALRAKKHLDCKLFDDPRVHIRFSKSDIGALEGLPARPSNDRYVRHDSPLDKPFPSRGGSDELMRDYPPREGPYGPPLDVSRGGGRLAYRDWPEHENDMFNRDAKRARGAPVMENSVDGAPPVGFGPSHSDRVGPLPAVPMPQGLPGPRPGAAQPPQFANPSQALPVGPPPMLPPKNVSPWVGNLAKGGTSICRARAFQVGKGIDTSLPDTVNCTARTDLDTLAKHIYSAGDFGVVALIPETDSDVGPYEDFVQYLGEKQRAGVAKLADGATLFLVPPSDFSLQVLKVPRNDSLFGVAINLSQTPGPAPIMPPLAQGGPAQQSVPTSQTFPPPSTLLPPVDSQVGYIPYQGQNTPPSQALQGQSPMPLQQQHPQPPQTTPAPPSLPAGLTPELLASLRHLLPQPQQNNQTSGQQPASQQQQQTNLERPMPNQGSGPPSYGASQGSTPQISSSMHPSAILPTRPLGGFNALVPAGGSSAPSQAPLSHRPTSGPQAPAAPQGPFYQTSYQGEQANQQHPSPLRTAYPPPAPPTSSYPSSSGGSGPAYGQSFPVQSQPSQPHSQPQQQQQQQSVQPPQPHSNTAPSPPMQQGQHPPGSAGTPPVGLVQQYGGQTTAHQAGQPRAPFAGPLAGPPQTSMPQLPPEQLAQLTALLNQQQNQQGHQQQQPQQQQQQVGSGQQPSAATPPPPVQAPPQQQPLYQQVAPQYQQGTYAPPPSQAQQPPQFQQSQGASSYQQQYQQPPGPQQQYQHPQQPTGPDAPSQTQPPQNEADSRKFQATLQLAAALLQQIQQQQQGKAPPSAPAP